MKRKLLWIGVLYGLLTSLVVMGLSYLGYYLFALPFLPFDLFDWLTRHLPGVLIEASIRTMISVIMSLQLGPTDTVAKLAEQVQALGVVLLTGGFFGLILAWVGKVRREWLMRAGLLGGALLWIGVVLAESSLPQASSIMVLGLVWLLVLLLGWGWVLSRLLKGFYPGVEETDPASAITTAKSKDSITRRNFMALAGSSLASLIILILGLANFRRPKASASNPNKGITGSTPSAPKISPGTTEGSPAPQGTPDKRIQPAPGTRPEITPADKFYRIDINTIPPEVDGSTWRLALKGLVQKPLSLSLDEIRSRPTITQAVTISCISNAVGGDLIGTNFWSGVRFKDILAEAGVMPSASGINIMSVDGFYEYVPLAEAMDERTLLVYAMNNEPLPAGHGFPLRIFIPNHYGMKQPKWITQMEVTNMSSAGYWVERGWDMNAIPMTTSAIDTKFVDKNELEKSGLVPLGGIAWAGQRGIQKVEVQIDKETWVEAQLRSPAIGPLTWVQWRYDWKPTPGEHRVNVRATDGEGNLQESILSNPGPFGATGIDFVYIKIN